MTFRISRRAVLRGLGGLAVGLPALEIMTPRGARAATPPGRFLVSYAGISIGADAYRLGIGETLDDGFTPTVVGEGYEVRRGTRSLETLGIRDEVSIVSGLTIPWTDGSTEVPPGGRSRYYHGNTGGPQLSGVRGPVDRRWTARGPSADRLFADARGEGRTFDVLAYRVQPESYVGSSRIGSSGSMSTYRNAEGNIRALEPIVSPRLAFESLFASFAPEDPVAAARARFALRQRRSVLDLVADDTERLSARLGSADRHRLDRHLEEIRGLERRLAAIDPSGGACRMLPHPGEDPPIGRTIIEYRGAGEPYSASGGYSDEAARADVLTDLIAMAFACDMTRSVAYQLTAAKCYMNMYPLSEDHFEFDMHAGTHRGSQPAVSDACSWLVEQWGKLVPKLRAMEESDGSSLLDHTAMVLLFEGGWGYDPEGGQSNIRAHSTENMVALVAGRAGGLRGGIHVRAPGAHPAQAVVSAMTAAGYPDDTLGEVTGTIGELFA